MILTIVGTLLSAIRHVLIVYCLRVSVSKAGAKSLKMLKTPSLFPLISPQNIKAALLGGKSITFSAKSITSTAKSIAFTSPPRKPRKHWLHACVKYPVR